MNEKIYVQLTKLQDELDTLDNAVAHISKAEQISRAVISATKTIQAQYGNHLQQVLNQYNDFLKNSYEHTEEQVKVLTDSHKTQIEKVGTVIEEYERLAQSTEKQSREQLDAALKHYESFLSKTQAHTQEKVENLSNSHQKQIEVVEKVLSEYQKLAKESEIQSGKQLEKTVNEYNTLLSKSLHTTETRIENIIDTHKKHLSEVSCLISELRKMANGFEQSSIDNVLDVKQQFTKHLEQHQEIVEQKLEGLIKGYQKNLDETHKILNEYLELAQVTAQLSAQLDKVDFKGNLEKINGNLDNTRKEISKLSDTIIAANQTVKAENQIEFGKIREMLSNSEERAILNNIISANEKLTKKVEHQISQSKVNKTLIIIAIALIVGQIIASFAGLL